MTYYMRQCKLQKKNTFQTTWLPEQFAKIKQYLKLKTKGDWDDGWQVIEVGSRMRSDLVIKNSQNYKHQRKASDI